MLALTDKTTTCTTAIAYNNSVNIIELYNM